MPRFGNPVTNAYGLDINARVVRLERVQLERVSQVYERRETYYRFSLRTEKTGTRTLLTTV